MGIIKIMNWGGLWWGRLRIRLGGLLGLFRAIVKLFLGDDHLY